MKKRYISPVISAADTELSQLICNSLGQGETPIVNFNNPEDDGSDKEADVRVFNTWNDFDDEEF